MEVWELLVRESVRATISAYNFATDRGDLDSMSACFSVSGNLKIPDTAAFVGRSAIVSGLTRSLSSQTEQPVHHRGSFVHHHVSSTHFTHVTPSKAGARSYFVVFDAAGPDHWGRYHDVFVPEDGSWLLLSRDVRVDGRSKPHD